MWTYTALLYDTYVHTAGAVYISIFDLFDICNTSGEQIKKSKWSQPRCFLISAGTNLHMPSKIFFV